MGHNEMKRMLYFGCLVKKGHYLWATESCHIANRSALKSVSAIDDVTDEFLISLDGAFTPLISAQGAYKESLVPPFRIIAWHDYTVDSRPGSNSALLGIGYESTDEMLDDAINHFPSVMKRQTSPLYLAMRL
jgi:hypothetical protein